MRKHNLLRIFGIGVFLSGGLVLAQVTTGTISGTVKDSTGGVLPGATVVLQNEATGISRTVEAGVAGRYSALGLSLGNYRVTATLEGFQRSVRTGIVLTVGREAVVDLELPVGAVTQTVEVTGDAPLVESTSASLGTLVDDRTIRSLPLNGRSYDQLALLQPGVILTNPGKIGGGPFVFGAGKRFSVGGQRNDSNSFLLDGTSINDQGNGTPGGAAGTNLGVDTILEFKILTNLFKAEYGRAGGAVVTAVTRSGTNILHGTAFEYIRNSAMDARNFFDVGSDPPTFRRNQFGGVLGGPIKRDRTFFFGGYEGLRQGLGITQIATVPTALARQGILPTGTVTVNPASVPFLDLYPLPNGRDFGDGTAEFLSAPSIVTNQDYFMGRVDHQLDEKTNIFVRYTFDDDNVDAPRNVGPTFVGITAARRQYSTLQANSVLGPNALNNFRFGFNRTFSTIVQTAPDEPSIVPGQPFGSVQIGAIGSFSRPLSLIGASSGNGPRLWVYNIFEWADDFTYVTGKHTLKTGVDIQRMRDNTSKTTGLRGAYTFDTLGDFIEGRPSDLQVSRPLGVPPYWGLRQTLYAVYAQDDYTVNSRLTVNVGFRWETTTDPMEVNGKTAILASPSATDTFTSGRLFSIGKKNFQPRVGLAWRLDESGRTVLRGGAGIYHNQIFPWLYALNLNIPPFFGRLRASDPPFPDGYKVFTADSQEGLIALKVMDPVVQTPVTNHYNLSLQQQIFENTVVEVAYAGNKASHLVALREVNKPIPTILPDGRKFFPSGAPRRNPAWKGILLTDTDANSVYNSVRFTLRRQSTSGVLGQIFYSFSKATTDATTQSGADSTRGPNILTDLEDRRRDWSLAEFNSEHAVVFNFSYPLPFQAGSKALGAFVNGWTLNSIGTFTAGLPYTASLAKSQSKDQASKSPDRPDLRPGASTNPTNETSVGCAGFPAGKRLRGADNFYDPCGFSLPAIGTYGNLGRNTLIGPGVASIDLGVEKSFNLRERASVMFRAEVFNIMNRTNLGLPVTRPLTATGTANASAGRITYTATSSRQLQFALRINF